MAGWPENGNRRKWNQTIPIGTAYAIWTGIGAVGTFLLGIMFFGDSASVARFFFVGLILVGIVGLNVASE